MEVVFKNVDCLKILTKHWLCAQKSRSGPSKIDKQTRKTIKEVNEKLKYIYDPHTATAVSARNGKGLRLENSVIVATAHPYKFLETVEPNLYHKELIPVPKQFSNIIDKKEKFDIIESAGVLHHMSEPMTGWRVLTDLLKPSGLMRIGLYSELASAMGL